MRRSHLWILSLVALGLILLVLALAWDYRAPLQAHARAGIEWLRGLGPTAFFAAMVFLPAIGVPLTIFPLTAGSAFGPQLGMVTVTGLVLLCLALNLSLSYVLARWVLRPWVLKFCRWLGYEVPDVSASDQLRLSLLVRVTPGPPYALQNYLLGLAAVPFRIYFAVSWGVFAIHACAWLLFGQALMDGRGRFALTGFGLLCAIAIGVHWMRTRLAKNDK